MNERRTPAVQTWLLTRFLTGPRRDAIIGDLVEAHHDGRSDAWYWRQALEAILMSFLVAMWEHKLIAVTALSLSFYASDVFMLVMRPSFIYRVDVWYRLLIDWLVTTEWDAARHLAYDLGLGFLTTRCLYCALAGAIARVLTKLSRAPRGVVVTLLLIPQLGESSLALASFCATSVREPFAAYSSLNLIWYAIFWLVAVPASVCAGGLRDGRIPGVLHTNP
jgi:hypothetical protein